MQKISTIINQLTNSDNSLSTPLFEIKVLATRIKNNELLSWVNREIEGFEPEDSLPAYRKVRGILKGSYIHGRSQFTNRPLPIPDISDSAREFLTSANICQSCTGIEYLVKSDHNDGTIRFALNGNIIQQLQSAYAKQNSYFSLYTAGIYTSTSSLHDILSTIRSKLLDLMLKLEAEYGESANVSDLSVSNPMINNYIQNFIYNNGNNNNINTGNGSTITTS